MEINADFEEKEEHENEDKDKYKEEKVWQQRCRKCTFHIISCHFIKLE